MDEFAVERVLLAVTLVPAGRVASYGDIGWAAGVGPRQVGAILRGSDGDLPWWRIVSADGTLPEPLLSRATAHWDAEGIAHRDGQVAMRTHRIDRRELVAAYRAATMN